MGNIETAAHRLHQFARRYGGHARKWTATEAGERERRRGVYAFVVQDGEVKVGDRIRKL